MQIPAHMAEATKRNTYRLYLNDEDTALMQRAAEVTELSQSELMSKLMSAALRAVAKNDYRFPLPLRFAVSEGISEAPSPRPPTKLRR